MLWRRNGYGGRPARRKIFSAAAAAAFLWIQVPAAKWLAGGEGAGLFLQAASATVLFGAETGWEETGTAQADAETETVETEETPESDPKPDTADEKEEKKDGELPLIVITRGGEKLYRSVEEYLPGVVVCQLPDGDWSEAVWQCQAVIARTCLKSLTDGRRCVPEEELSLETADEAALSSLRGQKLANRLALAEQAVRATAGRTLFYGDAAACPLFHAMSAGRTRNGGEEFPYLRSVSCAADRKREGFISRAAFSWQELAERLKRGTDAGNIDAWALPGTVQIVRRDGAGYVERMQLCGHGYTGDEVRFLLGLASAAFSVSESANGLTFLVRGSGHGYGLSQSYAQTLAESGASWEEILHYFYPDIVIAEE